MVTITFEDDCFLFKVKGLHKVWSLKSELKVHKTHIKEVHNNIASVNGLFDLRIPGTYLPGVIKAGTFWSVSSGEKSFWDVSDEKKSIVVELADAGLSKIVVEVENPEEAKKFILDRL